MLTAMDIGRRVRKRRSEQGLTVARLAVLSKVARTTVQRIERGTARPSEGTLQSLANALEVSIETLTKPYGARVRVRKPASAQPSEPAESPSQEGVPVAVVQALCTGRLGRVTPKELKRLIRNSRDPEFVADPALLELELLFRRACASMHDRKAKERFDLAFERIRQELMG